LPRCPQCGVPIDLVRGRRGPTRRYCSDTCRRMRRQPFPVRPCEQCQRPVAARLSQRFCSPGCARVSKSAALAATKQAARVRPCRYCGTPFESRYGALFCKPAHRHRFHREQRAIRFWITTPGGAPLTTDTDLDIDPDLITDTAEWYRFRSKFQATESGCWQWTAGVDGEGYRRPTRVNGMWLSPAKAS
jgi:hypothetical protein